MKAKEKEERVRDLKAQVYDCLAMKDFYMQRMQELQNELQQIQRIPIEEDIVVPPKSENEPSE